MQFNGGTVVSGSELSLCFEQKILISDSLKRMLNLNQPISKSVAVEPVWKVGLTDL